MNGFPMKLTTKELLEIENTAPPQGGHMLLRLAMQDPEALRVHKSRATPVERYLAHKKPLSSGTLP